MIGRTITVPLPRTGRLTKFFLANLYTMAMKVRPEIILACIFAVVVIMSSSWCGCSGGVVEGFKNALFAQGAALNYCMQKGVPRTVGQYEPPPGVYGADINPFSRYDGNKAGPVPPHNKFMFEKNRFDPSCCSSPYSNSLGCVCLSPDQAEYLNERGGNRTSGYF